MQASTSAGGGWLAGMQAPPPHTCMCASWSAMVYGKLCATSNVSPGRLNVITKESVQWHSGSAPEQPSRA
jgi:hypothetical protein